MGDSHILGSPAGKPLLLRCLRADIAVLPAAVCAVPGDGRVTAAGLHAGGLVGAVAGGAGEEGDAWHVQHGFGAGGVG